MKIQIVSTPKMKNGGNADVRPPKSSGYADQTSTYSLNTGSRIFDPTFSVKEPFRASESIQEVPREFANLEAEKGEVLTRQEQDGSLSKFNIGGKKHYNGGTPLQGEPGDFIFSDFKKLAIGGPILEQFGKSVGTKKFTPAEIAKQYDINKYKSILDNPDSDSLQKSTAARMVAGFTQKLGGLAVIQEAKKGFPQGIPELLGNNQQGIAQAKFGGNFQQGGTPFNFMLDPSQNSYDNSMPYVGDANFGTTGTRQVQILGVPYTNQPPYNGPATYDNPNKSLDVNAPASNIETEQANYRAKISTPDRIRQFADAIVPPHMGQPVRSQVRFPTLQVATPDNRAELAALQSSALSAIDANNLGADQQRARSANSDIYGRELQGVANSFGKNATDTANIMNKAYMDQAQLSKEQSLTNAGYNQKYSEESDRARFNYDQSLTNYFKTIGQDDAQARLNAAKVQQLNMLNAKDPFYADPRNLSLQWRKGYTGNVNGQGSSQEDFPSEVAKVKAQLVAKGITDAEAERQAYGYVMQSKVRTTTQMGQPQKSRTTTMNNQYGDNDYYDQNYNVGQWNGLPSNY